MSEPVLIAMICNVRRRSAFAIVATLCSLSAYAQSINGSCGTTPQTCATGTVTGVSNNGFNTEWTCSGSHGGTNAWCIAADPAPAPINGVCGTTVNTCAVGTVTNSSDNGINTQWDCTGSNNGAKAWCTASDAVATPINGVCGATANSCAVGTVTNSSNNGVNTQWDCTGLNNGAKAWCVIADSVVPAPAVVATTAGSKLGVNLGWVLDWSDRQMMFVDVMKDGRGFAQPAHYWDATDYPVPLDANGWPTADFGVLFLSNTGDPLNRPLTTTFPSFFGTYSLSFTGKAKVSGAGCCTIQNVNYNPQTNTTTASVVVGPTDSSVALTFTGTSGGVQNVRLLRPGYAIGTSQVFTNAFLKAIAPFSTLRFMDTLQTNGSPVTSWAQRTQPGAPEQSTASGLAWEYVIELANTSGKDIWVNIPEGVDLTDTTANNYATRLAQLMKSSLNPGIHVYLEYSNEVWNTGFQQNKANLASAIAEVNSGADPSLNYDHNTDPAYWGYRRTMHQIVRISELFKNVYGAAAINTTIRPLYLSQYVQPFLAEDALSYVKANFGAPSEFIYGIGGAPYFGGPQGPSYPTVASAVAALTSALSGIESGFPAQTYGGGVVSSGISYKGLADYYGLKSMSYEGGPALTNATSSVINENVDGSTALTPLITGYLADWFGCGNDLFMYYELAEPPGDIWGAYEDLSLATPKSSALTAVAATPLANFTRCTAP